MRPCYFWSRSCCGGGGQRRTPPGWTWTSHRDPSGPAICSAPSCTAVGGVDSSLSQIPPGCCTCSESREAPGFCHLPDINTNAATCDPWGRPCPSAGGGGGAEREKTRVSGFQKPLPPKRGRALQTATMKLEGAPSVQGRTPETRRLHASGGPPLGSVSLICMGRLHPDSTDLRRGPPAGHLVTMPFSALSWGQCKILACRQGPARSTLSVSCSQDFWAPG